MNVHLNVLIMKVTRSSKEFTLCGHVRPSAPPPQSLWEVYLGANPDSFLTHFLLCVKWPGSGRDCLRHGVPWSSFYRAQEEQKVSSPSLSPPASRSEGRCGQGLQCREGGRWSSGGTSSTTPVLPGCHHRAFSGCHSSQRGPGSGLGAASSSGCKCVHQVRTRRVDWWTPGRAVIQWRDGLSFPADASELDRHQTLTNWVQCMMILCCICLRSV